MKMIGICAVTGMCGLLQKSQSYDFWVAPRSIEEKRKELTTQE